MAEHSIADHKGNLGRYALYGEIAAGGMATVHLARLLGPVGFARTVAVKRLHPHLARDPDFVAMFLEEARLAARVRHPNVVSTLDVVSEDGELFLVMEYVAGESLSRLVRKTREAGKRVPPRYAVAIMAAALEGLHAAHEAKSERGVPLGMVHRDVSPQNIHVGIDGVTRVLDFGIAKATNRVQDTRTDQIKGKVAYMSAEQLAKAPVDRRADVYSASVVLWEALTGHRLFTADDVPALVYAIVNEEVLPPSTLVPDLPKGLDEIVMRGLDRDPAKRWSTAREMAAALERVLAPAPAREIGEWVEQTAGEALEDRQELVRRIESATTSTPPPALSRGLAIKSPSRPIEVASGVVRSESVPDAAPKPDRATLVEGAAARAVREGGLPILGEPDDEDDEDDRETLVHPGAQALALETGGHEARHHRRSIVLMGAVAVASLVVLGSLLAILLRAAPPEGDHAPAAVPAPPPATTAAASASAEPPESAIVIGGGQRAGTSPSAPSAAASSAAPRATSMLAPITKPKAPPRR